MPVTLSVDASELSDTELVVIGHFAARYRITTVRLIGVAGEHTRRLIDSAADGEVRVIAEHT